MTRTKTVLTFAALLAFVGVPSGRAAGHLPAVAHGRALPAVQLAPARLAVIQAPAKPPLDVERLRAAQERIVSAARSLPMPASLTELMRAVMKGVDEEATSRDAIEEHRTALVALAVYVNGWRLEALVPEARGWPRAERRSVLLRGRSDLTQHFMVSAVIAAFSGTPIANAVGLYKEMDDLRGSSGFSFSDLAADRAGTMFGDMAGRSGESARHLQARLSAGLTEDDMMPEIADLPDNLSPSEFTRLVGAVGAPAYNQLVEDIDRRVAALALFQ
jgi:hypothetical protein